ncbi:anti-sigma factor family protein [Rhodanobacter koreensis]
MSHSLLPLYFDGELDPVTSREFELHLDTCRECQVVLHGLDTVRTQMRDSATRFNAPNALREKIRDNLVSASKPIHRGAAMRTWMAVAASWLIVFLVGGGMGSLWHQHEGKMQAQNQFARDLFASHWRALAATSPVDVVSTDRHTVKPWFEGKIPASPTVNDFASQGFPLVGGRIDYVGDTRIPTLVYRHGKHLIDVFVFSQQLPADMQGETRVQGYEIRTAEINGEYAAVVTDMDDTEFGKFMQLLASKP